MRESMGTSWLFQIVIMFVLIFVAYLTVTINYSKGFKTKNEVITILEKYEGLTDGGTSGYGSITVINNYLSGVGYSATGSCPSEYYGAKSLTNNTYSNFEYVDGSSGSKYYYCIKKVTGYYEHKPTRSYYMVTLFVNMNLPSIGHIADFQATGRTTDLDITYDSGLFGN
jgi:hypothetical protein